MTTTISGLPVSNFQFPAATPEAGGDSSSGFADTLRNAIDEMGKTDAESSTAVTDLLAGNRSDVHNVMIAVEKADLSFQLMMQVRNKIVNAYQEISRLQF